MSRNAEKDVTSSLEMEEKQRAVCRERGVQYVPAGPDSKLGFADSTKGRLPINGLRHPPQADTNGWYIWCGENLSNAADFFSPLHTHHLRERCPEVLPLLGLPPGTRFLLADDYVDIWSDESLLHI